MRHRPPRREPHNVRQTNTRCQSKNHKGLTTRHGEYNAICPIHMALYHPYAGKAIGVSIYARYDRIRVL